MLTGLHCCYCKRQVLQCIAEWAGLEGLFKHMMDVTQRRDLPGLSAMKET